MVLARRPADRVQKEFKVDSVVRASMTSGSAMDIVYIQLGNMKPQVILIVFFFFLLVPLSLILYKIVFLSLPQECASASVGVSENQGWEED